MAALRPDEFDGVVISVAIGAAWDGAMVVSHLRPVLRREELGRRIGQVVRSWKEDGVWDAVIIFDGPSDGGTIDSVCSDVTADPPDDSVDLDRWRRTVTRIVGDACRGAIVDKDLG